MTTDLFKIKQTDYLQLSPMGVFPHSKGLQKVDRPILEKLVKNFNSFLARLGRRFVGVPFYIGHPDVHGFENLYPDRKAYGWIMELQVRDDGLFGKPKWSSAGRELIANGHYKFLSPHWRAEPAGMVDGRPTLAPIELISVGLTNEPNLPVLPLANTATEPSENAAIAGTPLALPDLRNDEVPESHPQPEGTTIEPTRDDRQEDGGKKVTANPNQAEHTVDLPSALSPTTSHFPIVPSNLEPEISHFQDDLSSLKSELANCTAQIAELRERLFTSVLDNAIANARILPAEREQWHLALDKNFDGASAELANCSAKLNLRSRAEELPRIPSVPIPSEAKRDRILMLVNERMRSSGMGFHQAWVNTKREHPALF